mgnify:CR=1 FL=1
MKLPTAPAGYDRRDQQEARSKLEKSDAENHKRGRHIDLGGLEFYPILYDTVTGARYSLTIASGVLTVTAL